MNSLVPSEFRLQSANTGLKDVVSKFINASVLETQKSIRVVLPSSVTSAASDLLRAHTALLDINIVQTAEISHEHPLAAATRRVAESLAWDWIKHSLQRDERAVIIGTTVDRVVYTRARATVYHPQHLMMSSKDNVRRVQAERSLQAGVADCKSRELSGDMIGGKGPFQRTPHNHVFVTSLDDLPSEYKYTRGVSLFASRFMSIRQIIDIMIAKDLTSWYGFEYGHTDMFTRTQGELMGSGLTWELNDVSQTIKFRFDGCLTPGYVHPAANVRQYMQPGVYGVRGTWWAVRQTAWHGWGVEFQIDRTAPYSPPRPVIPLPSSYYLVRSWYPATIGHSRYQFKPVNFAVHSSLHKLVYAGMLELYQAKGKVEFRDVLRLVQTSNTGYVINMVPIGAAETISIDNVFAYALACYVVVNEELGRLGIQVQRVKRRLDRLFSDNTFRSVIEAFIDDCYSWAKDTILTFLTQLSKSLIECSFEISLEEGVINPIYSVDVMSMVGLNDYSKSVDLGVFVRPADSETIADVLLSLTTEATDVKDTRVVPPEFTALEDEEEDVRELHIHNDDEKDETICSDGKFTPEFVKEACADFKDHHTTMKRERERELADIDWLVSVIPHFRSADKAVYRLTFVHGKAHIIEFRERPYAEGRNQLHESVTTGWEQFGVNTRVVVLQSDNASLVPGQILTLTSKGDRRVAKTTFDREKGCLLTIPYAGRVVLAFTAATDCWLHDRWIDTVDACVESQEWMTAVQSTDIINNDQITGAGKTFGVAATARPGEPMTASTRLASSEIFEKIKSMEFPTCDLDRWKTNITTVDHLIFFLRRGFNAHDLPYIEDRFRDLEIIDEDGHARLVIDEAVVLHVAQVFMLLGLYRMFVVPEAIVFQGRLEGDHRQNRWYAGDVLPTNTKLLSAFWSNVDKTPFNPITWRCPKDITKHLSRYYGVTCKTFNPVVHSVQEPVVGPLSSVNYSSKTVYSSFARNEVSDVTNHFQSRYRAAYNAARLSTDRGGKTHTIRVVQGGTFKKHHILHPKSCSTPPRIMRMDAMRLVAISRHTESLQYTGASDLNDCMLDELRDIRRQAHRVMDWSPWTATEADIRPQVRYLTPARLLTAREE